VATQLGSLPWAHFSCTQLLGLEKSVLVVGEVENKFTCVYEENFSGEYEHKPLSSHQF
jgi:hypothetical protein